MRRARGFTRRIRTGSTSPSQRPEAGLYVAGQVGPGRAPVGPARHRKEALPAQVPVAQRVRLTDPSPGLRSAAEFGTWETIRTRPPASDASAAARANERGLGPRLRRSARTSSRRSATLGDSFAGYDGLVHGGIVSTLLDEAMGWAILELAGRFAVTRSLTVEFRRPVSDRSPSQAQRAHRRRRSRRRAARRGRHRRHARSSACQRGRHLGSGAPQPCTCGQGTASVSKNGGQPP